MLTGQLIALGHLPLAPQQRPADAHQRRQEVLLRGMNVAGLLRAEDMPKGPGTPANDFSKMRADGCDVNRMPISG